MKRIPWFAAATVALSSTHLVTPGPAAALPGVTLPDVEFGTVQYDTEVSRVVTLKNTSGQTLLVSGYRTNDGQFKVSGFPAGVPSSSQCGNFDGGAGLASGGSCSLGVRFAPGGYDGRQATLSVDFRRRSDGATFGTATSTLRAVVVPGSLEVPATDFGAVAVGQSLTRVIELVNRGTGPLRVETARFNDAQFTATRYPSDVPAASQCGNKESYGSPLAPGGRCSVGLTFRPSGSGPRNAVLTIGTGSGSFEAGAAGTGTRSGYWMLSADGRVFPFGNVAPLGSPAGTLGANTALKLEPTASGNGYWILASNGAVFGYGDARPLGNLNLASLSGGERAASLSGTPSGAGYWVFTSHGRAVPFGDARHFGDMSKARLNGPVLGSVATPTGNGYYMVASDGGIFAFGDASFRGSMGGRPLNAPVGAVVPIASNAGYWLVASDGGIFAFDAPFLGSMGGGRLNRPVVGMIRYGNGYLMVASDGGIFNFSDRDFLGSLGGNPPSSPVVSVGAVY